MNEDIKKSVQRLEAAIQTLRAALSEQLACIEEDLKSQSGDVHGKVAERKNLARNLGLDRKLTEMWEEIRFYPSWCNRDDWLKYRLCNIDDPQESKHEEELDVSFLLNGHRYTFTYHDGGSTTGFDGDCLHHTLLSLRDGKNSVLIEINISIDYDCVGSVLNPFDVSGFIVGPWIQDFLECYELLLANKKERDIRKKYDSEKVRQLKEKFGLGQS